jgi:hypothetical protein
VKIITYNRKCVVLEEHCLFWDALSPLLLNFALKYTIRKVNVMRDWNWMEHITFWSVLIMLIYWKKTNSVKKNTECLLDASKKVVLKVNTQRCVFVFVKHGLSPWGKNWVLSRIFGPKRNEVTGGWRKLHNEELHNL